MAPPLPRRLLSSTAASPLAFLYQTRTLSPLSTAFRNSISRRFQHDSTDRIAIDANTSGNHNAEIKHPTNQESSDTQSTPTTPVPPRRTSYLRRKSTAITRHAPIRKPKPPPPKPKSTVQPKTITPGEREAFQNLFARLGAVKRDEDQQTEKAYASNNRPNGADISQLMQIFGATMEEKRTTKRKSEEKCEIIQPEPKPEPEPKPVPVPVAGGEKPEPPAEPQAELPKQPPKQPPGSPITLKDIKAADEVWNDEWENPSIEERQAINMVIRREVTKITEKLLTSIQQDKGDSGVWEVCTQQVFSMMHSLDQGSSAPSALSPSSPETARDRIDIPAILPADIVIAELYPKLLLQVFRMLGTYFPDSPILGQFRPSIYLLRRVPALYDEMVIFYWNRDKDLTAVVSFLQDMENAGLDPSKAVRKLLRDIVRQQREDMKAGPNSERRAFWEIPQNRAAFEELVGPFGWLEKSKGTGRRNRLPIPKMKRP
ncbi:hypothetical protein N7470_002721 [Penicillium chermesinum]|nr:hypothetical protein N7470_002721 [Penicillium chermesinum]